MQKDKLIKQIIKNSAGKRIVVLLSVTLFCSSVIYMAAAAKPVSKNDGNTKPALKRIPVSVESVEPVTIRASVETFAEVVPVWQTTLKAQVEGPVTYISKNLEVGNFVKKGEVLARIDNSAYLLNLAEAQSQLANARIEKLQEEREAGQALKNWKQSGLKEEPSPLALHKPQLEAAAAACNAAKKRLAFAEKQLGYTEFRAPYDGVITDKDINPGQALLAGEETIKLYAAQLLEIPVPLDSSQWDLLPESVAEIDCTVTDARTKKSWKAAAVRTAKHLGSQNRLRSLFLRVLDPCEDEKPLLPNSLVRINLTGRNMTGLLCIPESALTGKGLVWLIDENNKLRSLPAKPVFRRKGSIYIPAPNKAAGPVKVALFPNSSFVNDLAVNPVEREG
ncbi:MAG: efflux RND transporter periplasmic adaptor subunit [Desulfobacteraceae bacterium]|jgi:RND family efflux transporter MFP subunit